MFNSYIIKIYQKLMSLKEERSKRLRSKLWIKEFNGKTGDYKLNASQIKQIKEYYGKYKTAFDVSELYHTFYTEKTGEFHLKNIPDDIYYCYIDPYYNKWDKAEFMDNKCLYPRLFPNVRQPDNVLSRMNNIWIDSDYNLVDRETIKEIIGNYDELVVKQANESEGGKNITFISGEDMAEQLFAAADKIKKDIVVQNVLKQHSEISRINPTSINTIRILSMLSENGVKIYSAIIRMGVDGSRVDNASSGGITCGIDSEGRMKSVAFSNLGERFDVHPTSGVKFDSVVLPSFDKACAFVKKLHPMVPDFRLVSWDIMIDSDGEPELVEANFKYGELDFHQLNNGPVFGDDTEKILSEVFGK